MYGLIWRVLPGPWPVKLLQSLILVGAVIALLNWVVFPWVNTLVDTGEATVG
ncbi:hypothetical protein [Pseudoclavibacter sp. 13-3]|uniref:hypothetical protein n=1 Tax=Pseudoclavibacter sp. 13-3 TaxID=2901228 RepID=UPI001E3EBD68|nr:hypothetical protein [Pseudoclavibacter sp. 13-3]MCD7101151.1 hypothetical protein [Pseudoclavibacter sp. 13-3]